MSNTAKLFAGQKAAADIVSPVGVVLRMVDGKIPWDSLPIYFLSDNPLIASVAKLIYSGQSIDKARVHKLHQSAQATSGALKEQFLHEVAHDDFEIDVDFLTLEAEELLSGMEDEIVTLQLLEATTNA